MIKPRIFFTTDFKFLIYLKHILVFIIILYEAIKTQLMIRNALVINE